MKEIADSDITVVCYVSPHKILRFLQGLQEFTDGSRLICVARELTKKFEQIQRAPLSELIEYWTNNTPKGEFVLVISGKGYKE